jgi:hypothetical protein
MLCRVREHEELAAAAPADHTKIRCHTDVTTVACSPPFATVRKGFGAASDLDSVTLGERSRMPAVGSDRTCNRAVPGSSPGVGSAISPGQSGFLASLPAHHQIQGPFRASLKLHKSGLVVSVA